MSQLYHVSLWSVIEYKWVFPKWGLAKQRVMKWRARVISGSYDFGELCPNHAHFFEGQHPIS